MWHESFSAFLREDLKIEECEPYPCLLRTELSANAEKPACLLLLHVDDVLCLSQRNYLETVLLPALKARYKISNEVMSEEGDELTFLKRRHVLLSPNELAIQSHPKHLEKLFELLKIGRGLRPKKTPVHPLLDEDDNRVRRLWHFLAVRQRIRHISLRVLWVQKQVRDKLLAVGPVSTKHNPSDLGTKRLSRDRMLYLLFLCKAYDLRISEYVGSEVAERERQAEVTKQGIKVFRLAGMGNHDAKTLMRVMLLSALSLPVAASPSAVSCAMTWDSMAWTFVITLLCIAAGYIAFLHYKLNELSSDERRRGMWNNTLTKVMKLLVDYKKRVIAETGVEMEGDGEEEKMTEDESAEEESPASKRTRYMNAPMEECSDDELWRFYHHGVPAPEDPPQDHRDFSDRYIEQLMEDTNALLRRRVRRLRGEYDQACEANDQEAMDHLWGLICECEGLMYGRSW
eukprot:s4209_g4.t1